MHIDAQMLMRNNLPHSLWIPCFYLKTLHCVLCPSPKCVYCSYSRTMIYFLKTEYQQSMQYTKPFLRICTFNERLNNLFFLSLFRVLLCSGYVSSVCALIGSMVKRCWMFVSVAFIALVFAYITVSSWRVQMNCKGPLKVMMENVQKREFKIMWCSHDGFCLKEVETDL